MAEQRVPTRRDEYCAFRVLTTRWLDNDIYGHLNNIVHYALIDSAVNGWLIEHKLLDLHRSTQIGVVVESGCRYFSSIAYPDLVTAGIRVSNIGNTSVRYEIGLFRNDEDVASAEGYFVHVYVDRDSREPLPLTQTFRAAVETLQR
ncbi:acyl-CoA thioesterase [Aquamicrobium zhengzhouense]|uniref:Acyl-CoA thioesterase n=1 Tax=Aquamicrobium zhengzhouense TaxID=2781738 RepID=A0ABS0SE66_9HYPH|nr:thioesterase family protein [Aquamicrobium zhengzhouense]MBI1621561.1 acyl-CoA thioesterase [Aquamicrobium zhengzhouense]